ncbi:MAG TPA: hypothetical protein VJ742_12430 [Nitrososphaera sp.]|nr:hypothetical protein [Nitrososphaera sp.]
MLNNFRRKKGRSEEELDEESSFTIKYIDITGVMPLELGLVFDCPSCGAPAEVATLAFTINESVPYYIIRCMGEHDLVAVDHTWLDSEIRSRQ